MVFKLVIAALAMLPLLAQAGRPLQTEDAGVLDAAACELEAVDSLGRVDDETARRRSLQFGCGLGWHTQLAVQRAQPRETVFLGKTRLTPWAWREGEGQLAVAWSLAHVHPQGGWRRSGVGVVLVATVPVLPGWVGHANVGHAHDLLLPLRRTTWALALEQAGGALQPMMEVFGDDRGDRWVNAALRWTLVPERLAVDASYGIGRGRSRLTTFGLRASF